MCRGIGGWREGMMSRNTEEEGGEERGRESKGKERRVMGIWEVGS